MWSSKVPFTLEIPGLEVIKFPSHPHPALPSPPALSLPHLMSFNLRSHAEIFPTGVDCPHQSAHFLASEILQPPKSDNHQGNGALSQASGQPLSMLHCTSSSLEFQVATTRPMFEFMPARPNVVFTLAFDQHGLLGTFHVLGVGWGYQENQPQALPSGSLPAGWKDKPQTHNKRLQRAGRLLVPGPWHRTMPGVMWSGCESLVAWVIPPDCQHSGGMWYSHST